MVPTEEKKKNRPHFKSLALLKQPRLIIEPKEKVQIYFFIITFILIN